MPPAQRRRNVAKQRRAPGPAGRYRRAVPLAALPAIDRLTLAVVEAVPEEHPDHATFEPFPVHAWLVHHPDGPVLVDTGIGPGHPLIDAWYHPRVTPLAEALAGVGQDSGDIAAVVLSHLHFDHCGQQAALAAPVHVQADEHAAAGTEDYTIPEWADIPANRLRLVHGDEEIAPGLRLLATPGHTPGHQSVVVEAAGERVVLAAQCAFRAEEVRTGVLRPGNAFDPTWAVTAADSLARVRALGPAACHLSHDPALIELGPP
jgi:N-acyl homoserine lactone hydrolase